MCLWADQPGPGLYRLVGALGPLSQPLVTVDPRATGHVVVQFPYLLQQSAYYWPSMDLGGRPTGTCPPTRAAAIRTADALRARGPDAIRTWSLSWRWQRFDEAGPQRGRWVEVGADAPDVVLAAPSSASPGREAGA